MGEEDGITRGENMQRGEKLAEKTDEQRKNNERQTKGKALKQYKRNNRENTFRKQATTIPGNSVSVPGRKSKQTSKETKSKQAIQKFCTKRSIK